jgi:hypothetical protein
MNMEQEVLNAFERGKAFGFAEGMKSMRSEMNNEPVAWMQTWENQDGELKQTVNIEQIGKQDIPLYTHPVKELSGVEIIGMSGKYDFTYEVDIIDFARAILRKASEK